MGLKTKIFNSIYILLVPIKVQIGREILEKLYLILRYQIVSSQTLCNLSVHFNPTDIFTEKVAKCTDRFKLSARVRRPLKPSHTRR